MDVIGQIDNLGAKAQVIYSELGAAMTLTGSGGGSESSTAMPVGTSALDGLRDVGAEFQTDREWIDVSRVSRRLYLLTRLLIETSRSMPIMAAVAPAGQ
jgi:hypothetical protein